MINKLLRNLVFTAFICGLSGAAFADDINIYFGPKGGFSPENNQRKFVFSDNSERKATLSNSIKYCFDKLESGSTAKVAMYSMSDFTCLEAMTNACADKNIKVLLLLDGVTSWAKDSRDKIAKIIRKAGEKRKRQASLSTLLLRQFPTKL